MPAPLTIVAILQALPDHEDAVAEALIACIEPTLAEDGCLQYDLHRDNTTPGLFLFYENWASREQWQVHMESDHLKTMKEVTKGKMKPPVIHEMTRVGT